MTIRATLDTKSVATTLRDLSLIVKQPYRGKRGAQVEAKAKAVLRNQFARGGFEGATGFSAWPRTKPFGTKPATVPTLGGTGGSLAQAAAGGSGGVWSRTPRRVSLTIVPPVVIYWVAHDDGARIPVTDKMRGKVRALHGVNFRKDKTHLVLPRRPLIDPLAPVFARLARDVVVRDLVAVAG